MSELNIFERIQAVANEISTIKKDMDVGTGRSSYKAVSDLAVIKRVKAAEKKHRIVSVPSKQEVIHSETIRTVKDGYETIRYSFLIKMTTRIVNLDNPKDCIEVESFGHGLDSGDKGFGKASTYARKYALLNAYKIGTGEDSDNEPSQEDKLPLTPSEQRIAVTNFLNNDINLLQQVLKRFSIGDLSDLTEKEVQIVYGGFHQKGML